MCAQSATPVAADPTEEAGAAAAGKFSDPAWAWAPYEPDAQRPWTLRGAGHLYRRAAFGATWKQLQQALADGPQQTVERLLCGETNLSAALGEGLLTPPKPLALGEGLPTPPKPPTLGEGLPTPPKPRTEGLLQVPRQADLSAFNRTYDQYEAAAGDAADGLRAWWLRRMILTPHPLLEKMTLFWHNHFAVSNDKVGSALLMQRHLQLLRSHALGRFDALLMAVARDPGALVWLDGNANRQARPNEHFARALLESFTLGPDGCSPQDIREAARAFTGWFVLQHQFRFVEHEHDFGPKRILGQEGNFNGDDVVRLALRQPVTPQYLVRKLYRWLIAETHQPSDQLVVPLAESFAKDYDLAKLAETMLRSNLFFSPAAYRQRIKCPVEFALGMIKGLEELVPTAQLGHDLAVLGQNLYHPPSIKGWQGGRAWINRSTLLGRSNLAGALLAGSGTYGEKLDPAAVARKHGRAKGEAAGRFLLDLFLQGDVEPKIAETLLDPLARPGAAANGEAAQSLRELTHSVVCLPEFQLA